MPKHKNVKYYFDAELASLLSIKISRVYAQFDAGSFEESTTGCVGHLEYKARVAVFARELRAHLPGSYRDALKVLLEILGPENTKETGMFTEGYWIAPIAFFVETYGLNDYASSMKAISEITKRHTSEYAVRPYLQRHPDRTLAQMIRWSKSKNFHLRRLASEGVRPRLPWANMLPQYVEDPTPILPILENLKADQVKYVQKSVANCINDILKDHPKTGLSLVGRWASNSPTAETRRILRHSLRRLKKAEDKNALRILRKIG
ncbi:MAG: DNA alkylation repair protein [Acidiferrobacterales bacterium]|nr:DNA alkylation repair protein [Acidiferrobacterales bacterium]